MIVDRDGGRAPGELRGEKAVGRVETRLRRLGLAIFKEADGERRVAHRRRPHEHAPQVDLRNAKGHSLVSFEKVAEEVDGRRPDVRARVEHGELVPEEVDVVDVVAVRDMDEVAAASPAHLEEPQVRQDVAEDFDLDAPASPEVPLVAQSPARASFQLKIYD